MTYFDIKAEPKRVLFLIDVVLTSKTNVYTFIIKSYENGHKKVVF